MLSIKNQIALKAVSRKPMVNGKVNPEFGLVNPELNELTDRIRAEEPEQFLREHELRNRHFFDQPLSAIPCATYVRPYNK